MKLRQKPYATSSPSSSVAFEKWLGEMLEITKVEANKAGKQGDGTPPKKNQFQGLSLPSVAIWCVFLCCTSGPVTALIGQLGLRTAKGPDWPTQQKGGGGGKHGRLRTGWQSSVRTGLRHPGCWGWRGGRWSEKTATTHANTWKYWSGVTLRLFDITSFEEGFKSFRRKQRKKTTCIADVMLDFVTAFVSNAKCVQLVHPILLWLVVGNVHDTVNSCRLPQSWSNLWWVSLPNGGVDESTR